MAFQLKDFQEPETFSVILCAILSKSITVPSWCFFWALDFLVNRKFSYCISSQ